MSLPELIIELDKVRHNARVIRALSEPLGVEVVGVTKCFLGDPAIAKAFLDGGIKILADSRMENLQRLRQALPDVPLMLLRIPGLSQVERVVEIADVSLNSNLAVLEALSNEARRQNKEHGVIIMVDLGDLREGVWPQDLPGLTEKAGTLLGIHIDGLGVNLACYGGVIPTFEKLQQLLELTRDMEELLGYPLSVISGGNSATLSLVMKREVPPGVNQLRIGEGILFGRETVGRDEIPGAFSDAFVLRAEIIECYQKPSMPQGRIGQDAFGVRPVFFDKGWRRRGILALGRQDVPLEGLLPRDERLRLVGASSDHLIVDLTEAEEFSVGSVLEFELTYGGLLATMTSPFVHTRFVNGSQ